MDRRRLRAEAVDLVRATGRRLSGRDLAAAAATLTYYSGIAVVPWLLLAARLPTWPRGRDGAASYLGDLRVLVPPDMGGRPSYDALVHAGSQLGLLGLVVLLFPASFYGEGLRRAGLSLAPEADRFTGWRARIAILALVPALPLLSWAFMSVGRSLVPLAPEGGGGGVGDLLVRIVVGFTVVWLVLAVLLTWVFGVVMPGRPRWLVAAVGALATGSFLAGFLQGFALFLSLPVDVGLPFGGIGVVGGVVAVGLWLFVLHVFVLVGWSATRALDDRVRAVG